MPKSKSRTVKSKATQKVRAYDNTSRQDKSAQNRRLILETLVQLLVEKKGHDVTFKEIAARTGLAERSIYRFYNDKEELHHEIDRFLMTYIEASVEQLLTMDVAAFAKNAFQLFDKYESLVLAYLYSPFGRATRQRFRKSLNQLILKKLAEENHLARNSQNQKKVAIICSLINANIWNDIREDYGFSGQEMGDTVEWAIRALIQGLNK